MNPLMQLCWQFVAQEIFNRFDVMPRRFFVFLNLARVFVREGVERKVGGGTNARYGERRQKVEFEAGAGTEIGKLGEEIPQWGGL